MQKATLWGLVAIAIVGCRTQHVPQCRPDCTDTDQVTFAHCVAHGNVMPYCEAGNRACCATDSVFCVGPLDDQTVVSDADPATCMVTMTTTFTAPMCAMPCDAEVGARYRQCLVDGTMEDCVNPGDMECCALAQDCIGAFADVEVVHTGCCASPADCTTAGEVCDPMFWTCMATTPVDVCGDDTQGPTEGCDDGNRITETCMYGDRTCTEVCDATCHRLTVTPSFCGDDVVDDANEDCEPPDDPLICTHDCQSIQPLTCINGVMDGDESDIDCGGTTCAPCLAGRTCFGPRDCRASNTGTCGMASADCLITGGSYCMEHTSCDDGNRCTDDVCDATGGCTHPMFDHDGDGHFTMANGCGDDCNDLNSATFMDAPEICDGADNDCDETVDESCT